MTKAIAALVICTVIAITLPAIAPAADSQRSEIIVLKAAHLFDATNGSLRAGATVVVAGGTIRSVNSGLVPAGAEVIDLGDATLLPGFIDAHVHLASEMHESYYEDFYKEIHRFAAEQALHAALYARRTLEAGFTTVRNLGSPDFIDIGLRNAINDDVASGPRVLTSAHAIGSTGGHCDQSPFPPQRIEPLGPIKGICNGPEQCREAVRNQMKWGADVIKICASGGVLSESDPVDVPQLTTDELSAIVSEAHRWNRKVAAHAHGDLAAKLAVEAGVDSIEHGTFLTEQTMKLMKARGVHLVPTRLANYWIEKQADSYPPRISAKARAAAAAHAAMFRTAIRVGVPIVFGSDSGVSTHGINAKEFSLMTDLGMSAAAAITAATRDAASLLGIEPEIGTLEPGKQADIVAVRGNVLQDIRAAERPILVMKGGRIVMRTSERLP
jgi:imidazolonepropionase-like amidohydrolase